MTNERLNEVLEAFSQDNEAAICKWLKEGKFHANEPLKNGLSLLHLAAQEGKIWVINTLKEFPVNWNLHSREQGHSSLYKAISANQLMFAEKLIEAGANVDTANSDGVTPLWKAAFDGNETAVDLLLRSCKKINYADKKNGATPLYLAAQGGFESIVRKLISRGADINSQLDKIGYTPIFIAVANNHFHVVECLYHHGAEIELPDSNGLTPLELAINQEYSNIISLLRDQPKRVPTVEIIDSPEEVLKKEDYLRLEGEKLQRIENPFLEEEATKTQRVAFQYAKDLMIGMRDESINYAKIFNALKGLHQLEIQNIVNPRPLFLALLQAINGSSDAIDFKVKQEIFKFIRILMYLEFMKHWKDTGKMSAVPKSQYKEVDLKERVLHELKEEERIVQSQADGRPDAAMTGYLFELSMVKAIASIMLDLKVDHWVRDIFGKILQEGVLGIGGSALMTVAAMGKMTVDGASSAGGVISSATGSGIVGVRCKSKQYQRQGVGYFINPNYPVKHAKEVCRLIKDSASKMKQLAEFEWYIDAMLAYNYSLASFNSLEMLRDYLQSHLKSHVNSDWHVLYAGLDSLLDVVFKGNTFELQKEAFFGNQNLPGVIDFVDFGDEFVEMSDKESKKEVRKQARIKLNQKLPEKKRSHFHLFFKAKLLGKLEDASRVREKAVECCIWAARHENVEEIAGPAAGIILERRLRENDKKVLYLLNNPMEVLKVRNALDKEWEDTEAESQENMTNELAAIKEALKTSWNDNKKYFEGQVQEQMVLLKELQEELAVILKRSDSQARQQDIDILKEEILLQKEICQDFVGRVEEIGQDLKIVMSFLGEIRDQLGEIDAKLGKIDDNIERVVDQTSENAAKLDLVISLLSQSQKAIQLSPMMLSTPKDISDQEKSQNQMNEGVKEEIQKSYDNAKSLYQEAINNGSTEAKAYLGALFATGLGGKKVSRRARQLFEESANEGSLRGKFNLAMMCEKGEGGEIDFHKALKLYKELLGCGFEGLEKRAEVRIAKVETKIKAIQPKPLSSIDEHSFKMRLKGE